MFFQALEVSRLPRGQKETTWLEVAGRPDGGPWRLPFLYITGVSSGPTLLVIAGVHGDEYEGIATIPHIFGQLQASHVQGRLLMVPVCNMPAYEAASRSSPIDGLNLARVFPGHPDGSITQRIAYWLTEKLLRPADFLIDLHSGGLLYNLPTLIGYTSDKSDLGRRSQAAAEAFGAPVLWGHPLPMPPGRSLSAATDLGIPSLYTEAPGGGLAQPDDVACFAEGVLNVMKHLGMVEGQPRPRPMSHHLVGEGNMDQVISAPVAGYFHPEVELLQEVSAGQRLGTILDFFGQLLAEITADRVGVVIMLRRVHRVNVGDGLADITGRL
jgi:uncharacterized protein